VNGIPITLAEYQAEIAVYRAAVGVDLKPEDEKRVMDNLVDQVLLAQAAAEQGFVADDALVQERIQRLIDQLGGEQALTDWIAGHGYTDQTFRRALARSIAAAWMRDQITAALPKTAEQVRVRQILLYNSQMANEVYAQLQAGYDFGNLADTYDPVTGGELGWFPRGYLSDAKLEEAAFSLRPGQYSPVIETLAGFHILQVIEQNPQRPLSPEVVLILQSQAVQNWLKERRSQSDIQIVL
jgi:peptidyl-prolyl cis-trans isomerase C